MGELLHEKIYTDLLSKIRSHFYEEGVMLPTEQDMVSMYEASKAPIRQALGRLEQEGFIVRRAGKGTIVAGRSEWPYTRMGGNEYELTSKGKYLYCLTKSVKKSKITKELAEFMGLPVGTPVLEVVRIRYYKDEPVHYLHHYVVDVEKQIIEDAGNFSSLLAVYDANNIKISKAEDELQAVSASKEVAKWLKVIPGFPVLLNNRKTYREDGSLLEFMRFYINTKEWRYRVTYLNKNS